MLLAAVCVSCSYPPASHNNASRFSELLSDFDRGYQAIGISGMVFDYKENLSHIQTRDTLGMQQHFFQKISTRLAAIDRSSLSAADRINYDQISYEVAINEERLRLEEAFMTSHATVPDGGLYALDGAWYQYYIRYYTSTDATPDQLYSFGESEVKKVKGEISLIQKRLGYKNDSIGFYRMLHADSFYLTDEAQIRQRYEDISRTVYSNLRNLFMDTDIAPITFMEWPQANKFIPPGYYSPASDNKYNRGVFFYNFSERRHNIRSMEWLFLHEGVPGHHYQWCTRSKLPQQAAFKQLFFYPGNVEGWAAYVEYYGKDVGLYRGIYTELGKWEWDLVRSVRILIDVGIHHKGWTHEQALQCWRQNIPGQDEIAEREVTRCTNWPAQALSYKVGAQKIIELREALQKREGPGFDLRKFHARYLSYGNIPLDVIRKDMLQD